MVLPGHLAGGYLATTALLALTHVFFTPFQTGVLLVTGILAGEAPDIDLFWFYFEHRFSKSPKTENHRDYLTHAPIVWLCLSLIIIVDGIMASSSFIFFTGWSILVGSWTHFILDSIEYGVMWLWPYSHKRYCIRHIPDRKINKPVGSFSYYREAIQKTYIRNITFYAEILIVAVAFYVALR